MSVQAESATERRRAPRFSTGFAAELASGTALVPVTVRDLSISGCAIVIEVGALDHSDKFSDRGLLHLPSLDRGTYGTILPVILRNVRTDDRRVIYGLEFGPLLPHQARKLNGVLEAMGDPAEGSVSV